jgi:hypothetical protein
MRILPYQPIPASRVGFQTRRIQIDCSNSAATRTRQDENPALPTDFFRMAGFPTRHIWIVSFAH